MSSMSKRFSKLSPSGKSINISLKYNKLANNIEKQFKSEIHVKLLVTME